MKTIILVNSFTCSLLLFQLFESKSISHFDIFICQFSFLIIVPRLEFRHHLLLIKFSISNLYNIFSLLVKCIFHKPNAIPRLYLIMAIEFLVLTVIYCNQNEDGTKVEYRVWNPFRSKLAAAVLGGVDNIWMVILLQKTLVFMKEMQLLSYSYCVFSLLETWLEGALLRSCIWNHRLPCLRSCWPSK